MSIIQTNIVMSHSLSGLSASAYKRRTASESSFSADSITVTTSAEAVLLGDVITPRSIVTRLLSGDALQVGLDYGTDGIKYPFRLSAENDSQLLNLDVDGRKEVSTAETVADVAGSLNDKYFTLFDRNGEVKVVITNDGVTALTSTGRLVVVTIADDDVAADVASAIVAEFVGDAELTVSAVGDLVTFTDKHTGTRTNIATGDSGFTVAVTQQGDASPTIYLKSTGTSQVLVAVSPA